MRRTSHSSPNRNSAKSFEIKSVASPNRRPHKNSIITKRDAKVYVEIDGLAPITFYKARPDCFMPVDCFVATRVANTRPVSLALPDKAADVTDSLTIKFAWKNTTVSGHSGLKLVDLRDNEVLAYYENSYSRKTWAKLTVQGSGVQVLRLIVSTILALKFRSQLMETETAPVRSQSQRLRGKKSLPILPSQRHSFPNTSEHTSSCPQLPQI